MSDPLLTRLTATYYQEGDDCDTGADQVLTLTLDTAGAGPYLVIHTERWAIDFPDQLNTLLTTFVVAGRPLFEKPPCPSD